ncbi:hypothetical protein N7474_006379 [Penicillium riverlandense]|uniref:uncharacterized protein n=1 Tax=Penicillium riverlandense TaxID=1903569 RepID=UPI0025466584|nr:uncharacterized protein N7474_006379 [Penicillium riverlandense]KAJ5814602.1 hypothetical protein N7474_006379 [Penicillium riverlandense]
MEAGSVPRFASFKQPPPAPPELQRASDREGATSERDHEDHRHPKRRRRDGEDQGKGYRGHRKEPQRSRDHRSHRSEHRTRSPHSKRRRSNERSAVSSEKRREHEKVRSSNTIERSRARSPDETNDIYVIDRKGDRDIITYGTIHRYSIPEYLRTGAGFVIGIPSSYRIDRDLTTLDKVVLKPSAEFARAVGSTKSLLKSRIRTTDHVRIRPNSLSCPAENLAKDYLPFKTRRPKHTAGEIHSDDERHAYRSILGKAKPEDILSSDEEIVLGSESEGDETARSDPDTEIRLHNAKLSRAVENDPHDVSLWLQFIDYQDLLIRGSRAENQSLTYAERQGLADIKLSLYDKALKKAGKSPLTVRLLLGRLEEGGKIWDTKTLAAQWEAALKAHPGFISLWVKYLDFRQTESVNFTYSRSVNTFVECLKLNASNAAGAQRNQIQSYLFLRLTLLIREAGFLELAVALWQAILEFTCFRPKSLIQGHREKALILFQEFWESERPRIGEKGARGWKHGNGPEVEPGTRDYQHKMETRRMFSSWAETERERIHNGQMPARCLDAGDEDDLSRVVLFDDLQEILSLFWDVESVDELIDGFLYFCHLPHLAVAENSQTTRLWSGDNFLRNEFLDNPLYHLEQWVTRVENDASTPSMSPFLFRHHSFLHTTSTYFADPGSWFASFEAWKMASSTPSSVINSDWVRLSLRSLVEANPKDDELAEYSLAVEFACDLNVAKRYAKQLLKKRSSNMRLYNCFALMQHRSGSLSVAEHVWSTTLSMTSSFDERDRIDCGLLWNTWIWECMQSEDISRVRTLLHAMPHNSIDLKKLDADECPQQFIATNLLRIQNYLSNAQETAIGYRKPQVFAAYSDCLAILVYFADVLAFEKSLKVYSSAVTRLAALPLQEESVKAFTAELLHQARAKFIHYHIKRHGTFVPEQIRILLEESVSLFPRNTMFLSLLAWHKSRFHIYDRMRNIREPSGGNLNTAFDSLETFAISPVASQSTPVSNHLFAIYHELSRPVVGGSTVHSVRAAFERAIGDQSPPGDPTARHSADASTARSNLSLWKLYVLFELYANKDARRAKQVFYRGLRSCPWSKELIMLAFEHLRADILEGDSPTGNNQDGMGFYELCDLYNALDERELRIHVDIGAQLENMLYELKRKDQGAVANSALVAPVDLPDDPGSGDEKV